MSIDPLQKDSAARLLLQALRIAFQAGEVILEVYESAFAVQMKEDHSPLTLADQRSHDVIMRGLGSIPGNGSRLPVLSEEGRHIPYAERKTWHSFWLVDPLDGTKEFIKRNGEFTVNIALMQENRPVLGVIYTPAKGSFYFAARGIGSFRLTGGREVAGLLQGPQGDGHTVGDSGQVQDLLGAAKRLRPADTTGTSSRITLVGSRSHAGPEMQDLLKRLQARYERVDLVSAGSSLKFCMVADGSADLYVRHGPTMEWDIAAGQIIVEEAGGAVLNLATGAPLAYNKENLLNPGFVVERSSAREFSDLVQ